MELPPAGHAPVLAEETLRYLALRPGMTVVDCTVGRAGHALAIAPLLGPTGLLLALDCDPRNLAFARDRLAASPCPVRFFHANFSELPDVLDAAGIDAVDAILADLGVSTNQLFDSSYGLSLSAEMPLDMRLDPRTQRTAADLVNSLSQSDLADLLFQLAQERHSRLIARKIVEARQLWPITTTERLAGLVRKTIGRGGAKPGHIDPATRTFLALRMAVNQEMPNLEALLEQAPRFLRPGGRIAVLSFQSMEDGRVKRAFRAAQKAGVLTILTPKPVGPSAGELAANPSSRSAKLRVAQRGGS